MFQTHDGKIKAKSRKTEDLTFKIHPMSGSNPPHHPAFTVLQLCLREMKWNQSNSRAQNNEATTAPAAEQDRSHQKKSSCCFVSSSRSEDEAAVNCHNVPASLHINNLRFTSFSSQRETWKLIYWTEKIVFGVQRKLKVPKNKRLWYHFQSRTETFTIKTCIFIRTKEE